MRHGFNTSFLSDVSGGKAEVGSLRRGSSRSGCLLLAAGVGLGFGTVILYAQERALHPISLAGDAVEGFGEGVGGGVVFGGAGKPARDVYPFTRRILLLNAICGYAQLVGHADGSAGEGEI